MGTGVRDKYNIAINGKGYMLRGAPNSPGYRRDEVPTAVSRLAISDLQYSDFSGAGTFFTAQTDWSAGIKSDRKWQDDAKFYYSTNIDAYSEPGAFKLGRAIESDNDFSENLVVGGEFLLSGNYTKCVGTVGSVAARPKFYKYSGGSWSEVGDAGFNNDSIITFIVQDTSTGQVFVGIMNQDGANDDNLWKYTGSSWTDISDALNTAGAGGDDHKSCAVMVGTRLYVAVASDPNTTDSNNYIGYTDDQGTTYTQLIHNLATSGTYYDGVILDMVYYGGLLYAYTAISSSEVVLTAINTSSGVFTDVYRFTGVSFDRYYGFSQKLLHIVNNKLVITVPDKKIYEYDGNDLTEIFKRDEKKIAIGVEADCYLKRGGVLIDGRIEWGNLIYNGEAFFNGRKDTSDSTTANVFLVPLFTEVGQTTNRRFYTSLSDVSILLREDSDNYKATLAKNFLVFSEMSPVVSIDKLLASISLIFDPLVSGQEIAVEYSIDGGSNWTALDTITSVTEGTTATKRDFVIPTSIIYTKIFVRVKMAASGDNTPTIRDCIVGYKPIPNYKNRWQLRLNMSNGVKILNRQDDQRTGSDMLGGLWNEKATKQTVNFEDIDYVECRLTTELTSGATSAAVDKTIGFPQRGRIRAVSGGVAEEMIYTSADSTKLRGISRAQRGTKARAYLTGQVLKNDYSVYVERIGSDIAFTDENKTESIASVTLLES